MEEVGDAAQPFTWPWALWSWAASPEGTDSRFMDVAGDVWRVYFSFSSVPFPIALLCLFLSQGTRLLSVLQVCSWQSSARVAEGDFSGGLRTLLVLLWHWAPSLHKDRSTVRQKILLPYRILQKTLKSGIASYCLPLPAYPLGSMVSLSLLVCFHSTVNMSMKMCLGVETFCVAALLFSRVSRGTCGSRSLCARTSSGTGWSPSPSWKGRTCPEGAWQRFLFSSNWEIKDTRAR